MDTVERRGTGSHVFGRSDGSARSLGRAIVAAVAVASLAANAQGALGDGTDLPPLLDRSRALAAEIVPVARLRIGAHGPTRVGPGRRGRLVAHVKVRARRAGMRGVTWQVDGEPTDLLVGAKHRAHGRTVSFRVPPDVRHPILLSASVAHRDGGGTVASEIIHRGPQRPRSAAQSIERSVDLAGAGQGPNFCDLFAVAQSGALTSVTFDLVAMDLGSVGTAGASCADASAAVTFDGASVTVNGIALTDLTGSITESGLRIDGGVLNLPGMPSAQAALAFAGSATVNVPFVGGVLSGLNGTVPLTTVPYLAVPAGWEGAAAVTFSPLDGGDQVDVNATAIAPAPEEGAVMITGSIGMGGAVALMVTAANLMPIVGSDGSSTVFSGSGIITRQPGRPVAYGVAIGMVPPTDGGAFPLYGGVDISSAALRWDDTGLTLQGEMGLALGGATYAFGIAGPIADFAEWSLGVSDLGDGVISMTDLALIDPSGTISSTRDSQTGVTTLSMDVTANVSIAPGWASNVTVTSATGHIGIFCPSGTTDPSCTNHELQVQVDLGGVRTVGATSVPVETTLDVDVRTGRFTAAVGPVDSDP